MKATDTRGIGLTGLEVTCLGLGGVFLARDASFSEAEELVARAAQLGLGYFDTAPMYGLGESERRYSGPLAHLDRSQFVLSTKVGRVLQQDVGGSEPWSFDFSRDGVLRSFESSLKRLGLDRIDILFVHDPDDYPEQAIREAFPAIIELREQGLVKAIGAGMNQWEMELRFAEELPLDCFLLAGRYTLLEQDALLAFLPYCEANDISVIAGGPYNSGILASDLSEDANYNYGIAPTKMLEHARAIKAICDRHGVSLKAAALQFVLAHPAVAAVIPGAASVVEVEENIRMVEVAIPSDFWADLKEAGLLHPSSPVPA
ncbi:MAG: aldo/keto reductase [Dehalococcoidia bacterium]|nr:aldo/keto reductase [Dehalococcoidia bacterium]|tara:strand:+ start:20848 stop:21795 length:948 start_codon:yes stop_codon:yes gene_type:complete